MRERERERKVGSWIERKVARDTEWVRRERKKRTRSLERKRESDRKEIYFLILYYSSLKKMKGFLLYF